MKIPKDNHIFFQVSSIICQRLLSTWLEVLRKLSRRLQDLLRSSHKHHVRHSIICVVWLRGFVLGRMDLGCSIKTKSVLSESLWYGYLCNNEQKVCLIVWILTVQGGFDRLLFIKFYNLCTESLCSSYKLTHRLTFFDCIHMSTTCSQWINLYYKMSVLRCLFYTPLQPVMSESWFT